MSETGCFWGEAAFLGFCSGFGLGFGGGQFTLTSAPSQTAHLLLGVEPVEAAYSRGESVDFGVTVFNRLSPGLDAALSLTVTGPRGYYYYDFQHKKIEEAGKGLSS